MQFLKELQCTANGIKTDLPYQIWDAISSSGSSGLPLWVVRFFHNKPRYYAVNYLQCYTYYLSPKFIIGQLGLLNSILLICLIVVLFKAYPKYKYVFWVILLLYPLFMIFELFRYWP